MLKPVGQILLLIASLALLPGTALSSCAVAEFLGAETHHHTGLEDHGHGDCEGDPDHSTPCSEECSLDLDEALPGKPLPSISAVLLSDAAPWSRISMSPPESERGLSPGAIPRADHPPAWSTPPFSGVFRI